jgi:hypothetical protein
MTFDKEKGRDAYLEVRGNLEAVKGEDAAMIASNLAGVAATLKTLASIAIQTLSALPVEEGQEERVIEGMRVLKELTSTAMQCLSQVAALVEKQYPGLLKDCDMMLGTYAPPPDMMKREES